MCLLHSSASSDSDHGNNNNNSNSDTSTDIYFDHGDDDQDNLNNQVEHMNIYPDLSAFAATLEWRYIFNYKNVYKCVFLKILYINCKKL